MSQAHRTVSDMSLTQGLESPRTPLRRFLDRELSAGVRRLRMTFRAQLPADPLVLPGEGVGGEAGTVGTAIDQRLRLAFTSAAPVDAATVIGVDNICTTARWLAGDFGDQTAWDAIAEVGQRLVQQLHSIVAALDLDDRATPLLRDDHEEDRLARMLLAAAWYALNCRNAVAFPLTPLFKAAYANPRTFTLDRLLALPHPDLVADVIRQLRTAEQGNLAKLRFDTTAGECVSGPTFDGSADVSADADLIAAGTLVEIKSTRRVPDLPLAVIQQLLGYVLLDYSDRYRIDRVAVYMTRAGVLISWTLEDYLALLGARRRDLTALRAAFAELLAYPGCRADDDPLPDQLAGLQQLLADLAPVIPPGCCRVCAQPLASPTIGATRVRLYCTAFCSQRAQILRRRGWL